MNLLSSQLQYSTVNFFPFKGCSKMNFVCCQWIKKGNCKTGLLLKGCKLSFYLLNANFFLKLSVSILPFQTSCTFTAKWKCGRSFIQNCWRIFQKCRGTSHPTSEQGLEQLIVLLKPKEYLLKNNKIGNRLCLKNKQILELLVPKIRIGGSL